MKTRLIIDDRPGITRAFRPISARLLALLLGMLVAFVALEFGLAVLGMIYRWHYEQRAVPSEGRTVILCLGDSFTQGGRVSPRQRYSAQLQDLLDIEYGGDYRVVNAGLAGANTAMAKRVFLERVDAVNPRIVTLMIGPANYWNSVGYHRKGQSRPERVLADFWRRIRVIKLARLIFHQLSHKSQPGFQEEDSSLVPSGRIASGPVPRDAGSPRHVEPPSSESVSRLPDGFWADWSKKGLVRCRGTANRSGGIRFDLTAEVMDLVESNQVKKAQRRIQKSIRSRPADGRVHALEGMTHWANGNLAQAHSSFESARLLDPHDAYAELGMVGLANRSDQGHKAFEAISRIISAAPEDALLSRVAGHILEDNKDHAGALAMFQRSLRLDPCQSVSWAILGDIYEKIGRKDESRAMRREALRLDPSNSRVPVDFLNGEGRYAGIFHLGKLGRPDESGVNESGNPSRADLGSWLRDDVQSIADECRRRGIRVVIMNYPRPTYFPGYKELAASTGALFVDVQKAFEPLRANGSEARYFDSDGHCNAEGNSIIARMLAQEMKTAGFLP